MKYEDIEVGKAYYYLTRAGNAYCEVCAAKNDRCIVFETPSGIITLTDAELVIGEKQKKKTI